MPELNRIRLATEDDRAYHIDYWPRLFKATTWKELKTLAEQKQQLTSKIQRLLLQSAGIPDSKNN